METIKSEALERKLYDESLLNHTSCEVKVKKRIIGNYAIFCIVIATLTATCLGYDGGAISGAILFIQKDLNLTTVQVEFAVGSFNLIAIIGGLVSGRLSDLIGRRKTIAIASSILFLGPVVASSATSFAALMVGRLTTGIGVGFGLMIAPVYSAELSPAKIRGTLVSVIEIFINFGLLLGYIVNFALQGLPAHFNWRLMLGAGAVPSVLLAMGVMIMPETPRWLVTQNKLSEAKQILLKISDGDTEEAKLGLKEIMEAAGFTTTDCNIEPTIDELNVAFKEQKKQGEGVWRELIFPTRPLRRMLVAALGLQFFQQASGLDALIYYSPVIFSDAGITSKVAVLGATVGVGFTKFIFIFVATFYLDKVGRRPLLMISTAGMSLSLLSIAISFITFHMNNAHGETLMSVHVHQAAKPIATGAVITIFSMCCFVGFFSVGMGPITWIFVSEIFPLRVRGQAAGVGVIVNRLVSGTVALTFLSLSKRLTPAGAFFFYTAIAAAAFLFMYFVVPETKGKTLEELEKYFGANSGACHLAPAKTQDADHPIDAESLE